MSVMCITPLVSGTLLPPLHLPCPRLVAGATLDGISLRERRINVSRALCQSEFMRRFYRDYEFVFLLDSDCVVPPGSVDRLLAAWEQDTAPCIRTKTFSDGHVVTSACLLHRTQYETLDYLAAPERCQCRVIADRYRAYYLEGTEGFETKP